MIRSTTTTRLPIIVPTMSTSRTPLQIGIDYRNTRELPRDQVLALYCALGWTSAEKPEALLAALAGSHGLVTAWHGDQLVGLSNRLRSSR